VQRALLARDQHAAIRQPRHAPGLRRAGGDRFELPALGQRRLVDRRHFLRHGGSADRRQCGGQNQFFAQELSDNTRHNFLSQKTLNT